MLDEESPGLGAVLGVGGSGGREEEEEVSATHKSR